jgi:hypothetical protein
MRPKKSIFLADFPSCGQEINLGWPPLIWKKSLIDQKIYLVIGSQCAKFSHQNVTENSQIIVSFLLHIDQRASHPKKHIQTLPKPSRIQESIKNHFD